MLVQTGVVAGSLALAANAFLVPSTMNLDAARDSGFGLDIDYRLLETQQRTARLECADCPRLSSDEATSLILDFSTTAEGSVLTLNDHPFWPPRALFVSGANPQAVQIPADVSTTEYQVHSQPHFPMKMRDIGSIVKSRETAAADGSEGQIHDIDFTILELDGHPVTVDGLSIRLLTDSDGHIAIVDIIDVPTDKTRPAFDGSVPAPISHDDEEECHGLFKFFCEARNLAKQRMEQMRGRKPCPGKMPNGARLPIKGGIPKFMPFFGNAQEESHVISETEGYPRTEQEEWDQFTDFMHSVGSGLHRFLTGFVIPVMIGIAAGMTASLLGMVVGTGLAWLWIKVVRGGKRGNASAGQIMLVTDCDAVAAGEKEALMSEEEVIVVEDLPAYNEPPVYSEKE